MKIQTKQFGELEFSDELVIKFESGLFGFEELTKFVLIKQDDDLFFWLNSVEEPEIAFPMVGTKLLDEDYPDDNSDEGFAIVTLNPDPQKITVNLKAPVYINRDDKLGRQRILDTDKYAVDYNLFVDNGD